MNPENFPPLPPRTLKDDINRIAGGLIPKDINQETTSPDTPTEAVRPQFQYQNALRTYSSDLASALSDRKMSVAKIAIAENNEQQKTESVTQPVAVIRSQPVSESHILKNLLLLFLSILLLGGGGYGAYYFYIHSALNTVVPIAVVPKTQGIIPSTRQKEIVASSFTDTSIRDLIARERMTSQLKTNEIEEIYILMDTNGTKSLIPGAQAFPLLASNVPGEVIRSISPKIMLGILGTEGTPTAFILARSTFFQSTFTGMLGWENRMLQDWTPTLLDSEPSRQTGSTTYASRNPRFEDLTYRNKDVRVVRNDTGTIYFLYSFIDKENLIITTSLDSFDTLLGYYEKKSYIR